MKNYLKVLAALLVITFFYSCRKYDNRVIPIENCQVEKLVSSGSFNSVRTYTYDEKGMVSSTKMSLTFMNGDAEISFQNLYYYHRDNKGLLTSMEVAYEDNTGVSYLEPINVLNDVKGRVVKLIEYYSGKPSVTHHLKYNMQGLVSEHAIEFVDFPEFGNKTYFKYNLIGQMVNMERYKLDGTFIDEKVIENIGIALSNEAFLMQKGMLPFDMIFGEAFGLFDGGVGSKLKVYTNDAEGNKVLFNELKTKTITLNSRGYPKTVISEDDKGKVYNNQYGFNCNAFLIALND